MGEYKYKHTISGVYTEQDTFQRELERILFGVRFQVRLLHMY